MVNNKNNIKIKSDKNSDVKSYGGKKLKLSLQSPVF